MLSLLLFSCAMKTIQIGSVDVAEERICVIQLSDGYIIEMESNMCKNLKEGDVIHVTRKKEIIK